MGFCRRSNSLFSSDVTLHKLLPHHKEDNLAEFKSLVYGNMVITMKYHKSSRTETTANRYTVSITRT